MGIGVDRLGAGWVSSADVDVEPCPHQPLEAAGTDWCGVIGLGVGVVSTG